MKNLVRQVLKIMQDNLMTYSLRTDFAQQSRGVKHHLPFSGYFIYWTGWSHKEVKVKKPGILDFIPDLLVYFENNKILHVA